MAEPVGVASGIVALATFAFQSSLSLWQLIDSFKSNKKNVRALKEELEALDAVLESLQQATANSLIDIPSLKLPLLRCGQACEDFKTVIIKCTAHSSGSRTSFRDWAKLTYMGDDITGFKDMLSGYKQTINIALGDANFRRVAVTAKVLEEYKQLIADTTSDLEDHLQRIEEKLEGLHSQRGVISEEDAAERERIQEEKQSTEQCLAICAQVSKQVDQLRPNIFEDVSTPNGSHQVDVTTGKGLSAKRVTANVLQDCQEKLNKTQSELEERLQKIDSRLQQHSTPGTRVWGEAEQRGVQQQFDDVKQCLAVCAQAAEQVDEFRTNHFEDISAAQDTHQLIVSTIGDLISAKRVTVGASSNQWLGQMSDASLQQLSRDNPVKLRSKAPVDKAVGSQRESLTNFADQYGAGYKLSGNES